MAAARPPTLLHVPEVAAEATWRRVIDAQRDDLGLVLRRWPDRTSAEVVAATARLRRRTAPGGDADQAVEAIDALYGGRDRVPEAVRRWMEVYVEAQLGGRP